MKMIGDFLANLGIFSADLSYISSIILCTILILIGVGMSLLAFIPSKPSNCNKVNICKKFGNDSEECKDETKRCNKKTNNWTLLLFLLLIPLGLGIFYLARWWKNYIHHHRTASQVVGTLEGVEIVKDIL